MSSTSFHSEEFPRSHERRRFIRQRVRSLAYLDVGPDNGGIVLNLSENGIALQAVNPFIDQTRVSLRIQPPTSRKRIETSAEITWLSESKKEAGLRFLELSDDVRVELADWISAEAATGEQRPLDDSAPPQTRQGPSKSITEEPARLRGKWSIMLGDSTSEESLENQKAPNPIPNPPIGRRNLESQPDAPPPGTFPTDPANNPASSVMVIHPLSSNGNNSPVRPQMSAERISDLAGFPSLGSQLPVAASAPHEAASLAAADPIAKRDETPDVPLRELNSTSRQFLAGRFRKWWAIAALCGCTTLVFLFLGMAFTRRLLHDRFGKSSVDERARAANAAPSAPVAHGPSSQGAGSRSGASASKTRHIDAGKVARASRVEDPGKRKDENPQPDSRDGEIDSPVAKLSSPIDSLQPTTKSDSQNVSVPSWPALSVQPSDAHNLTVDPPAVKTSSPAGADRRNDCYLIYRVEPLYPREAKEQHIEGTVTIHLLIGMDGRVRSLRELSGPGPLVPAALAAARDWRFIPALLNGQPIDAEKDVNIAFRLPR
jgi:TonB family protein